MTLTYGASENRDRDRQVADVAAGAASVDQAVHALGAPSWILVTDSSGKVTFIDGRHTVMSPRGQTRDTVRWKGTSEPGTYKFIQSTMAASAPIRMNGPSGR